MVTCRDEVLAVIPSVSATDGTFAVEAVVAALRAQGSQYSPSTIRTHVTSRMCGNSPNHHGTVYDDLVRVDRGRYRLRSRTR